MHTELNGTAEREGIRINEAQRLYVIPCGGGFSCYGFDVLERKREALAAELRGLGYGAHVTGEAGTLAAWENWRHLQNTAADHHRRTGYRFRYELTPQLIGLEGKRVEVEDTHGGRRRFWVSRSTGWAPCHLEIARRNCHGGMAALGPFRSVRVVEVRR